MNDADHISLEKFSEMQCAESRVKSDKTSLFFAFK